MLSSSSSPSSAMMRSKSCSPSDTSEPVSVTVLGPYWDHSFLTSFSSIHRRHSPRCASPFDVSQPIWVYTVVHTMLLPCLGSPANAVHLFPCGTALVSSLSFSFDILCSHLVSIFCVRSCCSLFGSLFACHLVDDTFLSREKLLPATPASVL
jgi:hypothetical protein